jgi:predicted outer membrane protein
MKRFIPVLLVIASFFSSCNSDNEENTTTTEERAATLQYEEQFVKDVIEDSGEELALLQSGRDSCTDAELKANATQMLSDHLKTDNDFRAYAQKKRTNEEGVDMDKRFTFSHPKGNERDIEWATKVRERHEALTKRFEEAMEKVKEPELKKLIKDNLQNIDTHRIMAEKLIEKLNAQPANVTHPPLTE